MRNGFLGWVQRLAGDWRRLLWVGLFLAAAAGALEVLQPWKTEWVTLLDGRLWRNTVFEHERAWRDLLDVLWMGAAFVFCCGLGLWMVESRAWTRVAAWMRQVLGAMSGTRQEPRPTEMVDRATELAARCSRQEPANGWKYWCLVLMAVLLLGAAGVVPIIVPTGRTLWVDSVNGSDVSGRRGLVTSPFLTIPAAVTNALPGDLVHVLPGTNDCGTNGILRRNVNYFFEPGSLVIWSNVNMTADVYCLFDDRQTGPTTNTVSGSGRFFATAYRTGNDDANFNIRGLIAVTNTGTELHFQGTRLEISAPTQGAVQGNVSALNVWDGKVWLDVDEIVDPYPGDGGTHSSVAMGIYWQLGEIHVKCERLVMQNYYGMWGHDPTAGSTRANFWYDGNSIISSNYVGVYVDGTAGVDSPNYRSYFNVKDVSGGSIGYSFIGQSRVYINSQKVSSPSGTALDSAAVLWAQIEKVSGTNILVSLRGGEAYLQVLQYEDLMADNVAGSKKLLLVSGNNRILGGNYRAKNTNAIYFAHVQGGTNWFQDLNLDMSKAGTTNAWGVYMDSTNGEALVLQNCTFKISGSTSNSMSATNPQTARVRGQFYSSTNVHPLVALWGGTVEAANREVLPGNFLPDYMVAVPRYVISGGSGATFTGFGDVGTVASFGTAVLMLADATGPTSVLMPTAGSTSSQVSFSGNLNYRMGKNCFMKCWAGITNQSNFILWVCLTDQAATVPSVDNPAGNYMGMRYSTASDSSFKLINKDNVTQSVVDTTRVLGSGYHSFGVVVDDAGTNVVGWLDGLPVGTNSLKTPAPGTSMRFVVALTTVANATNALRGAWAYMKSGN